MKRLVHESLSVMKRLVHESLSVTVCDEEVPVNQIPGGFATAGWCLAVSPHCDRHTYTHTPHTPAEPLHTPHTPHTHTQNLNMTVGEGFIYFLQMQSRGEWERRSRRGAKHTEIGRASCRERV